MNSPPSPSQLPALHKALRSWAPTAEAGLANIEIAWAVTDPISVFDEARQLGFDLRKFDDQSDEVRFAVKKASVDHIIKKIRAEWRGAYGDEYKPHQDFNAIKNGVYVIAIGAGFGVGYPKDCSEVMYIGRGKIASRLRSHLNNWIFDMSLSLRDVPFKFYMETVADGRSRNAFKDFEHFLLERFSDKFGDKPLINKIHGRAGTIDHDFGGNWNAPLSNRGKQYIWSIKPTEKNDWFKEYVDE